MSTYPQSGARGLQRFIWLKYYIVQKCEVIFTLGLKAVKNTDFMEKSSSKSCLELNFQEECQWTHMSISPPPPSVELGSKD